VTEDLAVQRLEDSPETHRILMRAEAAPARAVLIDRDAII
jgi:hypothetical protein